jgi:hypothetical protein
MHPVHSHGATHVSFPHSAAISQVPSRQARTVEPSQRAGCPDSQRVGSSGWQPARTRNIASSDGIFAPMLRRDPQRPLRDAPESAMSPTRATCPAKLRQGGA